MEGKPLVSVVIPTFNERENVGAILESLRKILEGSMLKPYEIIVVDDASDDLTWLEALRKAAEHANGQVRVLVRKRWGRLGSGLASAIRAGSLAARGEYVVVMDADFQHPPEVVPVLVEKLREGYDIVVASRYTRGGGVSNWSLVRFLMSKAAVALTKLLLPEVGGRTADPMSGFFAFRNSNGVRESMLKMRPRGFKFLLELLALNPQARVTDVPYVFRRRRAGSSKLGTKTMIDFMVQVVTASRAHRFAAVGASGVAVNLGVMWAALKALGDEDIASILGIEASVLSNFALNEAWTFRGCREGTLLRRLIGYHASSAVGMAVTYGVMKALVVAFDANPLVGQAIGILFGFLANFTLSRNRVWGCRRPAG